MNKILIIDDDTFLTGLYSTLLEKEGIQVDVVNSGEEALSWLSASIPDLVVLDIHMPGMKGTDVLRGIRNDARLRHLHVIVFSTGYIQSLVAEVGDLRAQKVLSKMKCKPRALVAEIKDSLANLPSNSIAAEPGQCAKSALEIAAGNINHPVGEDRAYWLERLQSDSGMEARRTCLLNIYSMYCEQITRAMRADAASSEGKLGRALKKVLDDLYDHPHLIQASTAQSIDQALRKLPRLKVSENKTALESEAMLNDVLDSL